MAKLNRVQLRFLVLVIFIIIIALAFFFMYNNNKNDANNLETENLEDLKAQNQENIIKAQSYRAPSLRTIDDSDVFVGDLDSDLEIIVYEDYSNAFSAKYEGSLDKLLSEYGDDLVLAFRPFSVSNNGLSSDANQALYCANDEGRYLDYRKEVFNRLNDSNLYENDLYIIASDLALDEEKFSNCLNTNEYLDEVNSLSKEANDFGVFGAPTTFVGDELVIGARKWQDSIDSNGEQIEGLKTIVETHLSK
jgi:protein-disulfide isomerase